MANEMPTFAASSYASSTASLDELFQTNGLETAVSGHRPLLRAHFNQPQQEMPNMAVAIGRRVVQVFVSDPNPNLSLENCLLYKGDVQVTDLTDQELYFELDIRKLLADHNEKRTKTVDKTIKDRVEYLEPAKIRDLKMSVVTVTTL